jgi:hypothetical protein
LAFTGTGVEGNATSGNGKLIRGKVAVTTTQLWDEGFRQALQTGTVLDITFIFLQFFTTAVKFYDSHQAIERVKGQPQG